MSPMEQRKVAPSIFVDSSSSDRERMKVLKRKIPTRDLEPLHENSFETFFKKSSLFGHYEWVEKQLREEIMEEYLDATKQSILDFILLDPLEQKRLKIETLHQAPRLNTVRAPVPWHDCFMTAKNFCEKHLHTTSSPIYELTRLWDEKFSTELFFQGDKKTFGMHKSPQEFIMAVNNRCDEVRDVLVTQWLPKAAEILEEHFQSSQKRYDVKALKRNDPEAVEDIMELFNCVASLMSSQVRRLVKDSLTRLVIFVEVHKDPSILKKAEDYDLLNFIQKEPVLNLKIVANDSPQPGFSPSLETTKEIIASCFEYIIESGSGFNRLELLLFPEHMDQLPTQNLFSVAPSEDWVVSLLARADYVVSQHAPNIETFLEVYAPFDDILSGNELESVSTFIFESNDKECEDIASRILKLRAVLNQVNGLYPNCALGLFFLDCTQINFELIELVKDLENRIVDDQVQKNRQLNRQINREYEEIGRKLAREPEDTEELVNIMNYLREVVKVKKDALSARVQKAGIRLGFLIEFATLEEEDYRINYNVLSQPEHLRNVLDFNEEKFAVKKVTAENTVRQKSKDIELELERITKAIEKFNTEETNSSEETKRLVELLSSLREDLDKVGDRIEHLNFEESLLEREESVFDAHPDGIREMQPFQQLWETAHDWNVKSESWLNGTFRKIKVDEMAEDISNMWRLLFKLSKMFSDTPAPRRMADTVRTKIDKFKRDLPIIQALGAKGMRPRHWDRVEEVVGTDIRPDEDTTLLQMLEFNLGQHLPKLEEIAVSAAKEYALERTLDKMKEDWHEMKFILLPYRDTVMSRLSNLINIFIFLHRIKNLRM